MDTRDKNEERRLKSLDDMSGYKVASGDPDVRGWEVVDVNNQRVGKIDNLLVDTEAEKVRYLDVELDENLIKEGHEPYAHGKATGVHEYENRDGEVHMIIPIGLARVDKNNNTVISDDINRSTIENGYLHRKGDHISPDYEKKVVSTLSESEKQSTTHASDEFRTRTKGETPGTVSETKKHGIPLEEKEKTSGTRPESERATGNERYESDLKNREMRRPESPSDTNLSQEAKRKERVKEDKDRDTGNYGPDKTKPYREESWSFETQNNPRHGRFDENTRGPVQSNFYTHRYFDEKRFYGRG